MIVPTVNNCIIYDERKISNKCHTKKRNKKNTT